MRECSLSERECLVMAYEALNSAMQIVAGQIGAAQEPDQAVSLSFGLRAVIREMEEVNHMVGACWNRGPRPVDKEGT